MSRMEMNRRLALALLAALAIAPLAACAGSRAKPVEAAPAPPKPPEEAFAWMPEDGTTLGRAVLGPLRSSTLWPLWERLARERKLESWVALDKVDVVTFGGTGDSEEDASYVVALEGRFSPTELRDLAARDGVAAEAQGLLTVYRRPDGVWTQITPRLIVHGSPDRLERLVARASAGPGAKARETELYKSLAERVGLEQAHAAVIAQDDGTGQGKAKLERRASRLGLGGLTRDAVRLGGGLSVGGTYRATGVEETGDEAQAKAVEGRARSTIDSYANNFVVRMLGASGVLSALRVGSEGRYVTVRGDVPEQELNALLGRLEGAFDFAARTGMRE